MRWVTPGPGDLTAPARSAALAWLADIAGRGYQQPALSTILVEAERAEPDLAYDGLGSALLQGGDGLGRSFCWPSQTSGLSSAHSGT